MLYVACQGTWWYNSCYRSNLNGMYDNDGSNTDNTGLKNGRGGDQTSDTPELRTPVYASQVAEMFACSIPALLTSLYHKDNQIEAVSQE